MSGETRSLPRNAKTLAAVAKIQNFDDLPRTADIEEMNRLIADEGFRELQRGIHPYGGLSAGFFARDLAVGPYYPGTHPAYGHGLYFATPTETRTDDYCSQRGFTMLSKTAVEYAKKGEPGPGILVRAALRNDARTLSLTELLDIRRQHSAKLIHVGIRDPGSLAAAWGVDAYYVDVSTCIEPEPVWIVVNRAALVVQKIALQIPKDPPSISLRP